MMILHGLFILFHITQFAIMAAIMMIDDMLTVVDAMVACGVDHDHLFMDETQAQRLASDIFGDQFSLCLDITFKELDEHFKTYSDLTVVQGQIRVRPGTRKNIKAFVQWARDELRLGRNPTMTPFPVEQVSDLIRRYKTHEKFLNDSKTLSEAAKPDKFKESTKWEDWKPTFLNYLRSIPGRDGIPLKFICREKDEADVNAVNEDFSMTMLLRHFSKEIHTRLTPSKCIRSYLISSLAMTLQRRKSKGCLELTMDVKLSNA
jgi:hypothetical protein